RGIAVSGHMHGAVLVDAAGSVIRPCLLWNDTRAVDQAARLDAEPAFRAITGNIVFPGFTAPKVLWVRDNERDAFDRITKILLPKDYLNWWLTGRYANEMSDAAGSSWLDTGARAWSDDLIEASGISRDHLSDLVEGTSPVEELSAERARALGLPQGVVVVGGAADNAAAACGAGAFRAAEGFVSLGTSGVLLAACDGYSPAPATAVHTFCHAIPGAWYQMGVTLCATDSLNWLAGLAGRRPAEMTAALARDTGAPGRALFLPYLSGERTPHNDAAPRGTFLGLARSDGWPEMTRAVLEGVAYSQRDSLDALGATGTRPERLLALGGGSRSDLWVDMLAQVLGVPIDRPKQGDFGAALGAARLAMIGAGGARPADVLTPPPVERTFEPRPADTDRWAEGRHRYANASSAIRNLT
ncbi:MAG: xylulokinase, partial [Pseudomonadota bacterium]